MSNLSNCIRHSNVYYDTENHGKSRGIIYEFNTKIKKYSDNSFKIIHSTYSNLKGLSKNNKHNGTSTLEQLERYKALRVYKRKEEIRDLAYENACIKQWDYFVTLTFDDFLVNGYSHEEVQRNLVKWLNNQKKQNPGMRYILVPELHKSGRIHFHGLFSDVPNWKLKEARSPKTNKIIYKNGSKIFNLVNYKLGYTTVSEIKDMERVCFYITKYITKELLNLNNKKNYWHSKNLIKPGTTYAFFSKEQLNNFIDSNNQTITYQSEVNYRNFINTKKLT